jgi:hypothetical protein
MLVEIIAVTLLLEAVTCFGRFVFRLRARDWRMPVRIHHGYVGIVVLLGWFFVQNDWILIAGSSLVLSDALHHFVVLPLAVGSTEFP